MGEVFMRYLLSIVLVLLVSIPVYAVNFRELFEREFLSKPWTIERAEESTCIECHTSELMKAELRGIPQKWKKSWHYKNGISCDDCHGGDREDKDMAMSHKRGFVGKPGYSEVPEFCGKCHIGILKNYKMSGHGRALRFTGTGPNCVTCHGSHNIQQASVDIIYERRCTQCHSYERAKAIKQALFGIEDRMRKLSDNILSLKAQGVYMDEEERELFRTKAEFRTLFHTIDVGIIKDNTESFSQRLDAIEEKINGLFKELDFRRNFSMFLMLLFAGMAVVISLISNRYKE